MTKVDARGYACPQPVLMTKKALAKDNEVDILVDNNTALQNIQRFASNNGAKFSFEKSGEDYIISLRK